MQNFFYHIGRKAGKTIKKGKWMWSSFAGNSSEALQAEYAVGRDLAIQFDRELSARNSPFLDDIARPMLHLVKNKERHFRFALAQSEEVNAFALPGGFIYVTEALVQNCKSDPDTLAFVIGHEMIHVILGHPLKRIFTDTSLNVIAGMISTRGMLGQATRQTLFKLIRSNYSQDKEFEADRYGYQLMISAGYDKAGAYRLFSSLEQSKGQEPRLFNYFSSHPQYQERIARLKRIKF